MDGYRKSSHVVFDIKYHVIWVTKYRYKVLHGPIAVRTRELIRQGCEARGITILQGSVGMDHIHLLLSCPPSMAPSKMLPYLKGRSSRLLQDEFPELKKRYWGQHLWARGYFCATVGTVTEVIIRNYIANQFNEGTDEMFKIDE
ncbi:MULTISPECIES: IS200/IS605 family transposase [unclassified Sporosarcina]|uniref:IS200/IS605 family transposase n=1 Tax=unclassified Sporosarcina TaxID=2647733 RepID=UPI00203E55A0|nr:MULTISPECIES: IS200/IS605 family transposase [unclassified Sporosarcina]GKV65243.1 IS200/IS605 family transposase [Sporosarcina sp. NCCP-2331]GLB55367.1 IS200/IS605 family transposase [Sporosarcina sp. NCCP-2378]